MKRFHAIQDSGAKLDEVNPISQWQNFYVLVGSAAGALTGIQFVVIVLITQIKTAVDARGIHAYGSPTVVHFCSALAISALMAAPLQSLEAFGGCLLGGGVLGVVYSARIFFHARQADYDAELDDWIWYTAAPLVFHVALITAGVLLCLNVAAGLYVVAVDSLLFVLLGVRNAWDTVTYMAVEHSKKG